MGAMAESVRGIHIEGIDFRGSMECQSFDSYHSTLLEFTL